MQKGWLVAAGVVGVVLAVLLIPRPDTGEDVAVRKVRVGDVETVAPEGEDELVRGASQASLDELKSRSPAAIPLAADGTIATPGTIDAKNPLARVQQAQLQTPESQYAARALAPWTQVRREINPTDRSDLEGVELAEEINGLVADLRQLRRAPEQVDFAALEQKQRDLMAKVRSQGRSTEEAERMFELVDQRLTQYHNGELGAEEPAPGE